LAVAGVARILIQHRFTRKTVNFALDVGRVKTPSLIG